MFLKGLLISIACLVILLSFQPVSTAYSQDILQKNISLNHNRAPEKNITNVKFVKGEIIVKFRESPDNNPAIININKKYKASSFDEIFKSDKKSKLSNIYKIKIAENADIDAVISDYMGSGVVEYAEPNYIYRAMIVPNDTYYSLQWGHQKMDSEKAWDIERGSENIVIAIIDTGVQWNHTDLAANIWNNTDEIANNSIDDDGNGYIDDVRGWNFVSKNADPADDNGHGTHVAGIAAAVTNNSVGVAGMCWYCKIMPIKFLKFDGTGTDSDAALAIKYAADNNASIISTSWGAYIENSSLIGDALDYAYSKNIVLVAAAGNENTYLPLYPASYDNVISVSALAYNSSAKADFSNFGYSIEVAAPGESVYSTYYRNGYTSLSGTSMATPYVSGLAGLILSKNPNFTNRDVMNIIRISADPVVSPAYIGAGKINASRALQINYSPPEAQITSPSSEQVLQGVVGIAGSTDSGIINYTVEYGSGAYPKEWATLGFYTSSVINNTLAAWDTTGVRDGEYTLRLRTNDINGWNVAGVHVIVSNNDSICYSCGDCSYKLSKNGAHVFLAANITTCNCINIGGNKTILDCNGNSISGCGWSYVDEDNWNKGVGMNGRSNVLVRNCTLMELDFSVYANNSVNVTVIANYINNSYDGVYFKNSNNVIVYNNTFNINYDEAIKFFYAENSTIANNAFPFNYYGSILVDKSRYITTSNNTIGSTRREATQIGITNSDYNTISNNNVICGYEGDGIFLRNSSFNLIESNYVRSCYPAILLALSSDNNLVLSNRAASSYVGIWLMSTLNNILMKNNMTTNDNNLYVSGESGGIGPKQHYNHSIDTSNTANGGPVYYMFDKQSTVFENFTAGQIELAFGKNVTVRNLTIIGGDGIGLMLTNDSRIYGNRISNVITGVEISFSYRNIVENNTIFNTSSSGVYVSGTFSALTAGNNTIRGNIIKLSKSYGIALLTEGNVVYSNGVYLAYYGIYIGSDRNIIRTNGIYNSVNGIYIAYAQNDTIEYNNFYNSSGYHMRKEYYQNVTAVSNWWGSTNETQISAKIYDCNDSIGAGCVMFKPYLMQPFGLPNVSIVECEKNTSTWGNCSNIDYGDYLTRIRINCSSILRNITTTNLKFVDNKSNYTFFDANTTDYDNYFYYDNDDIQMNNSGSVALYASCVDNESALGGDKYSWFIHPQGDTNKDCIVDIFDLGRVGKCFGQAPVGFCGTGDVDRNGVINIFDLAAVGITFGEKC